MVFQNRKKYGSKEIISTFTTEVWWMQVFHALHSCSFVLRALSIAHFVSFCHSYGTLRSSHILLVFFFSILLSLAPSLLNLAPRVIFGTCFDIFLFLFGIFFYLSLHSLCYFCPSTCSVTFHLFRHPFSFWHSQSFCRFLCSFRHSSCCFGIVCCLFLCSLCIFILGIFCSFRHCLY